VDVTTEREEDRFPAPERTACGCGSRCGRSLARPIAQNDDEREDASEQDAGEQQELAKESHEEDGRAEIDCPGTIARPWSRLEAVRKGIVQLVAIGVVIGVALTLVAVLFQWLPESASEEFDRIQAIYWFVTIISIVIFSLVTGVVVFSVWKWRVPEDDDADGPPIHGHTGLEILWTAVPAVLVTAIGIFSAIVLARNGEAGSRPLEVQAMGQQFTWKFAYSDFEDADGKPVTTGELVLPVGQEARFTMTSVDVIHSFWVPNFGQKMDAVPGIETEILVTPNRMGDFAVVCTELCGLGHATMRAKASVVSQQDFEAWIEEQQA
jgi:cytochrome c oxidase subunit II